MRRPVLLWQLLHSGDYKRFFIFYGNFISAKFRVNSDGKVGDELKDGIVVYRKTDS